MNSTWVHAVYRAIFLPVLRAQPLCSSIFGPVKGAHPSLADWSVERSRKGQTCAELHSPGCVFSRPVHNNPAVVALPRVPLTFSEYAEHSIPRLYVAEVKQARLATRFIEVISPDDRVFRDLGYSRTDGSVGFASLVRPWLPRLQRRSGTFGVISTGRMANYYHWLNDCLPRLWLLDQQPECRFRLVIPETTCPFHIESLSLLGFGADRLVRFGNDHWQVERLLVPSLVNQASQTNPTATRWLRDRILLATGAASSKCVRRLYISRRLATKRRLTNEGEIVELLKSRGFEEVASENLSFAEQVRLFSEAEVVVGPHGAGLTNVMFMPAGGSLVELLDHRRVKSCYFSLASAVDVRYSCITDAPDDKDEVRTGRQPDTDFSIPLNRVKLALDELKI